MICDKEFVDEQSWWNEAGKLGMIAADVTKADVIQKVVHAIMEKYGKIDILAIWFWSLWGGGGQASLSTM